MNVILFGKNVFIDIDNKKISRRGDYSRLFGWALYNHKGPFERKAGRYSHGRRQRGGEREKEREIGRYLKMLYYWP